MEPQSVNGEALYNLWREAAWELHLENNEPWAELDRDEQLTWNELAEKLVSRGTE